MNAFDNIRETIEKLNTNISKSIKEQFRRRQETGKRDDEYRKQLALDAQEASTMLRSSSFPRFKRYVDETLVQLYRELRDLGLAANIENSEHLKRVIQVSAKIDVLETLRNRPDRLVAEIKSYEPEEE